MPSPLAALVLAAALPLVPDGMQDFLRQQGKPPADYLLSKLDDHRIVIVGESHWQRSDAELIGGIVSELRRLRVTLAMEFFPASSQADIDALISAPEWNRALANDIMRAGDWPYLQYRDILHQAWEASRSPGAPMSVLALGPPANWREQGIRYDAFMAERVRGYAADDEHRVLVYCGMHHGFTHYLQVERLRNGRATEFMDRMGNILWRQFGQDVFLVALHKPDGCGAAGDAFAKLCAPLDGTIDCAAARNGGAAVGFDILGSPIAERKLDAKSFYAAGHPLLRMVDLVDGYVWQLPVEDMTMVELIPLGEYAPAQAEDREQRAAWAKRGEDLANPRKRPSWSSLSDWRAKCDGSGGRPRAGEGLGQEDP
jgi:heme-binding uptake protein ChaN (Tiki superfamily)